MQRREFLATSIGAILTAGMPPQPDDWKVFHYGGDYVAARWKLDAQQYFVGFIGELVPLHAIDELQIGDFEDRCFQPLEDDPLPRARIPIAPWIREQLAGEPDVPCYLFTDDD